jgi:hypothetical protein
VDTDNTPTYPAAPASFFRFNESIQAVLLDVFQIFNHAHPILGPVTLIQSFESPAGVFGTFITKTGSAGHDVFTVLDAASQAGNHFLGIFPAAAGAMLFFSDICQANSAVHTAGGYQQRFGHHSPKPPRPKAVHAVSFSLSFLAHGHFSAGRSRIQ